MTPCEQCAVRSECPGFDGCEDGVTEEEYVRLSRQFHLNELAEELGQHTDDKWYLDPQ